MVFSLSATTGLAETVNRWACSLKIGLLTISIGCPHPRSGRILIRPGT